MNTTQIQNVKEWIKELRSGNWKQITNKLCTEDGYCCLGVACEMQGILVPYPLSRNIKGIIDSLGYFASGLPDHYWFKDYYGINLYQQFDYITKNGEKEKMTLPELNDFGGYTFDEIADVLENYIKEKNETTQTC